MQKRLKANEKIWKERWDSAANPFIAVYEDCSEEQRSERRPIIKAVIEARENLNQVKMESR